jgi:hypothetical protein
MEYKTLKSGKRSSVKRPKMNRSGNPLSISLFEAYRIVTEDYGVKIDKAVYDNLIALTEIRDNSIHFVNEDLLLSSKIQECNRLVPSAKISATHAATAGNFGAGLPLRRSAIT